MGSGRRRGGGGGRTRGQGSGCQLLLQLTHLLLQLLALVPRGSCFFLCLLELLRALLQLALHAHELLLTCAVLCCPLALLLAELRPQLGELLLSSVCISYR